MKDAPIVCLEGLNGVGKSTLALSLAEQLEVEPLRVFRRRNTLGTVHLGREDGGLMAALRKAGVPVNTFVDSLYTADFLAATGIGAVLDRCIGSGVAYGSWDKTIRDREHALDVLQLWCSTLAYSNVLYVYLKASPETRRARASDRWAPDEHQAAYLEGVFDWVYEKLVVAKIIVDTTNKTPEEVAREILLGA